MPLGVKFGDDLALLRDLPLHPCNSLLSFRQTSLKGRPIHIGIATGLGHRKITSATQTTANMMAPAARMAASMSCPWR